MSIATVIVAAHALVSASLIAWMVRCIHHALTDHITDANARTQPLPRITAAELRQRYPQTPARAGRAPDRPAPAGSTPRGSA